MCTALVPCPLVLGGSLSGVGTCTHQQTSLYHSPLRTANPFSAAKTPGHSCSLSSPVCKALCVLKFLRKAGKKSMQLCHSDRRLSSPLASQYPVTQVSCIILQFCIWVRYTLKLMFIQFTSPGFFLPPHYHAIEFLNKTFPFHYIP